MKNRRKISGIAGALVLFLGIVFYSSTSYSQNSGLENEIYGMGFSFQSSRLINSRMFVEGNYTLGRRTFEIGVSTGSYTSDEQGFLFKHKIFLNKKLNKKESFNLDNHRFKTFAVYKFVMFTSSAKHLRKDFKVVESDFVINNPVSTPTINTIEHYLGVGMEFTFFNHLSVEAMGGAGINFVRNNSNLEIIEDKLLSQANTDLSWDLTFGINYRF
jgi:hypothetical protein